MTRCTSRNKPMFLRREAVFGVDSQDQIHRTGDAAGVAMNDERVCLDFGLLVNRARFLRRLVEDRNSMNGGYWTCPACGSHEFTVPIPSLVLTCGNCFEPLMGPDLLAAVRGRKSQPGSCLS